MIELDVLSATLHNGSERVDLPPREFAVLASLALSPRVWPSYQLIPLLWPRAEITESSCLKVYVHRLRRRLGRNAIVSTNRGYELDREMKVDLWQMNDILAQDQLSEGDREELFRYVAAARGSNRDFLTRWPWFNRMEELIQREVAAAWSRLADAPGTDQQPVVPARRSWLVAGGNGARRLTARQAAV